MKKILLALFIYLGTSVCLSYPVINSDKLILPSQGTEFSFPFDSTNGNKLIVTACAEGSGDGRHIQSVSYAGTEMNEAVADNDNVSASGSQHASIWYLDLTSTDVGDIVVTFDGLVNGAGISAILLAGSNPGGPIDTDKGDGLTADLTLVDSSIAVVAMVANGGAVGIDASLDSIFVSTNIGSASAAVGYQYLETGTSKTYSFSADGSRPVTVGAVFDIDAQAYQKAINPLPAVNATKIPAETTLQWEAPNSPDGEIQGYRIYLDPVEANLNSQEADFTQSITSTTFTPPTTLLRDTEYFWRVDVVTNNSTILGDIWHFITAPEPLVPLAADINEDSVVNLLDMKICASYWLEMITHDSDIDKSGKIDMEDCSMLASQWHKEGDVPGSYVVTRYHDGDFKIFNEGKVATIYVDDNDYTVCGIAAESLASDIEKVCGTRPNIVHDTSSLSGNVIFIGTIGKSSVIDAFASQGKIDISDVEGLWEAGVLTVTDNPLANVERGLVISGSDKRGTAFAVFDLSQKMGVSPWYWWADMPVRYRESLIVRAGRYHQGPPSVKYRGIFINDEDWCLHAWALNTYSPEDGGIGPKVYKRVFELLLRLKANHIWPAMHGVTKAFNAYEENKFIADEYAIVMGSSHCEPLMRNNVWEWYRWSPSDGSSRSSWDWCTNSNQLLEYWDDRMKINGEFENVYTVGMRGVHDNNMPCSGASDYEKMLAMQNEVFPKQREIIANRVNSDVTKVPQVFCPYKEVLNLYNMGMQVPDDITIMWPDDNYGYMRRLSNSQERTRSGRAGLYYHMSYWGTPDDTLWICTSPPALLWEEMKKSYDYGADQVWVFNVGDIKPMEICTEFLMQMAWDIDRWDNTNIKDFLKQWAWREFGAKYKDEIADILVEYYHFGQARRPEHLAGVGAKFSPTHYGDELQKRLDKLQATVDKAEAVYSSLPASFKDAYYQTILYPLRGMNFMNQKILYSQKNQLYAQQGRMSANKYAQLTQEAFDNLAAENERYMSDENANGKWDEMMNWKDNRPVYPMPGTLTVTPENGAILGLALENQTVELTDIEVTNQPFNDNFSNGNADNWTPNNATLWEVRANSSQMEYAINTSDYNSPADGLLGAFSIIDANVYDNFELTLKVRSCDNLTTNSSADLAVIFSYIDENNYNYFIISSNSANSALHTVAAGTRTTITTCDLAINDNNFHDVAITKDSTGIIITYDGQEVAVASVVVAQGKIGVGSFNDSAAFTDIAITHLESVPSNELPAFDVFTKQKYFVDVFNKGDTAFTWTATPSANWISLDTSSGYVTDQQRVWVSMDWDNVPEGENDATIVFSGAGATKTAHINAIKPSYSIGDADFVQFGEYACMEAENYSRRFAKSGLKWEIISTLGNTGDTIAVFPVTVESRKDVAEVLATSPSLEYDLYLTKTGEQQITVSCIPTHAISTDHQLRYAIALDDQTPQFVEFDTEELAPEWLVNVLQGAAFTSSMHNVQQAGEHTLKIWMVDPGVVLDKIVIGNVPFAHLGPDETSLK